MGYREDAILTGLYQDIQHYLSPEYRAGAMGYGFATEKRNIAAAKHGEAAVAPGRWVKRSYTPSESVMNSRTYKRLEKLGYVVRCHTEFSTQTSALRITPAGEAEAKRLLGLEGGVDA